MIPGIWIQKIKRYLSRKTLEYFVFLLAGITLAVFLRLSVRGFLSPDNAVWFTPWYDLIKKEGLASLQHHPSNYPPLYLYFLWITSIVFPSFDTVFAVKVPSIGFDFICGLFVSLIIWRRYHSTWLSMLALFMLLYLPVVVFNSAVWGQIDIIYTALMVGCLYFLLQRKSFLAMFMFGLALSVKFQSVFLAPFLAIMVLKGWIRWRDLLLVPLVFVITIIPNWILGKPLLDLLLIYYGQTQQFQYLTMHFPNLYAWIPNQFFSMFFKAGVIWSAAVCLLYVFIGYKTNKQLTDALIVELALLSTLILPFTLPTMHERYDLAADVLSILYLFHFPKRFYLSVGINALSMSYYTSALFGYEYIPLLIGSLFLLAMISLLFYFTISDLHKPKSPRPILEELQEATEIGFRDS